MIGVELTDSQDLIFSDETNEHETLEVE